MPQKCAVPAMVDSMRLLAMKAMTALAGMRPHREHSQTVDLDLPVSNKKLLPTLETTTFALPKRKMNTTMPLREKSVATTLTALVTMSNAILV